MLRFFRWVFAVLCVTPALWPGSIPLNPPVPEGLGVNIHFTSPRPGEMKEMAAAGIHWIRTDFTWADTERVKGKYDFSAYDRLLAALQPYHIRAILVLDYGNKFYDHGLAPYDSLGRQAFARWAVAAVRHFRGRGIVWEMWNEPNGFFWKPRANARNYILLALAVGEAIRENQPGATYIGPAGALIDLPFLTKCFQAGLLNYWDAVTVHPYRQRIPETVTPEYARLRALIAKYSPRGKEIPIISGEWGYPSIRSWWGLTDTSQAKMLAREWLTNLSNHIPISIWYDWHDDGADPHNYLLHFGLVRFPYDAGRNPAFEPKPAYQAARTLTHLLDGTTFRERLQAGGPSDYVLLFAGHGQRWLAVWTTSPTPHKVLIRGLQGKFSAYSMVGVKEKSLRARHRMLRVTVTDAPQYLAATANKN